MPASLPYLSSNKNVEALFSTIQSAKVPDRFTQEFLATTLGLKGANDRGMIPLLRNLGFLDQSAAPTPTHRQLKNRDSAKTAIANGVRAAYAPLFEANENAQSLPSEKLKGLVAQVAGTDDDMTARIVATFNALSKQGDFSIRTVAAAPIDDEVVTDLNSSEAEANERPSTRGVSSASSVVEVNATRYSFPFLSSSRLLSAE